MGNGKRANGEGSISKRKDGRWQGRYVVHTANGPKRKAVYGKTRAEARRKLNSALRDRDSGTVDFEADNVTFGQWLEHWLTDFARDSVAERTLMQYEQRVEGHIVPALGNVKLKDLTPRRLQSLYRAKLEEGLSASTVLGIHSTASGALKAAYVQGVINSNPASRVQLPRLAQNEIHALTDDEARRLLDTAKTSEHFEINRLYALYALALATGLRHSELLGLRWADIDLQGRTLSLRRQYTLARPKKDGGPGYEYRPPKTRRARSVTFGAGAAKALTEHSAAAKRERLSFGGERHGYIDSDQVFTYPDGRVLPIWKSQRLWLKLADEAGVAGTRFHDLRHTYATLALERNVHPKVVQEALGHSTIKQTLDVYSHVIPSMATDAADKVNDALF